MFGKKKSTAKQIAINASICAGAGAAGGLVAWVVCDLLREEDPRIKELTLVAQSHQEALEGILEVKRGLSKEVSNLRKEVEEVKAGGLVAAERRASLVKEIEALKGQISPPGEDGLPSLVSLTKKLMDDEPLLP